MGSAVISIDGDFSSPPFRLRLHYPFGSARYIFLRNRFHLKKIDATLFGTLSLVPCWLAQVGGGGPADFDLGFDSGIVQLARRGTDFKSGF